MNCSLSPIGCILCINRNISWPLKVYFKQRLRVICYEFFLCQFKPIYHEIIFEDLERIMFSMLLTHKWRDTDVIRLDPRVVESHGHLWWSIQWAAIIPPNWNKHPWLIRDSKPGPIACHSNALITMLTGHHLNNILHKNLSSYISSRKIMLHCYFVLLCSFH